MSIASGQTAMNSLSLAESEEELNESLSGQYSDEDAYEIMNFEHLSSATLNTYEYVVKYNSTNMWAYAVTYGIVAQNEAYVITGTVTDDNEVLLQAVQQAVESFTVLNNSRFYGNARAVRLLLQTSLSHRLSPRATPALQRSFSP